MGEARDTLQALFLEGALEHERHKIDEEIRKFLFRQASEVTDKRKSPRVPVSIPVTYFICAGNRWDKFARGMRSLNLSSAGMKTVMDERLSPGQFLFMRFELMQTHVQILGQVKWSADLWGKNVTGIEFSDNSPQAREILEEFVRLERSKWFENIRKETGKDRRMFFRITTRISLAFFVYGRTFLQKWEKQKGKLVLLDLSAGGARVRCQEKLTKGSLVSFSLPLPHHAQPMALIGKILWGKEGKNGESTYGLLFANMEEEHRDAIVRYVLHEEQRLLRGRKIL